MKRTDKIKWLKALRSGKYSQGQDCLKDGDDYCCLGVLCDVTNTMPEDPGVSFADQTSTGTARPFLGLSRMMQHSLAVRNDGGNTFEEIADHIEKYVKVED